VLEDVVAQVADEIKRKQIGLTLALSPADPAIHADAVRLQQIFWNLIKNAVKFTPEGGKITVASKAEGDQAEIAITDTGIGLTADEMANIFDAFSQGDHAKSGSNHQFGGLGLGLTISQKLAELHEGKIQAESEGRDRGAKFTVKLPLVLDGQRQHSSADRAAHSATPATPGKQGGLKILLVEDHEATRVSLARLLMRRNYEVVTAASLAEARKAAEDHDFQLLISDIGLPDGNGCDLMVELKKTRPLNGIALTGFGMEQDLARSRDAGFVTHLIKPVRIQSLEAALSTVLQRPV